MGGSTVPETVATVAVYPAEPDPLPGYGGARADPGVRSLQHPPERLARENGAESCKKSKSLEKQEDDEG